MAFSIPSGGPSNVPCEPAIAAEPSRRFGALDSSLRASSLRASSLRATGHRALRLGVVLCGFGSLLQIGCSDLDRTFLEPQADNDARPSRPGDPSGEPTAAAGAGGEAGSENGPVVDGASGGSGGAGSLGLAGNSGVPPIDLDERPGLDARPAAVTSSVFPEHLEVSARGWLAVDAFPNLTFENATNLAEAPGTGHLFVTEQKGRIYAFRKSPEETEKRLVLDLSQRTQSFNDSGLLGLAFHPEFGRLDSANRGYIFVHYAFSEQPLVGQGAPVEPRTPTYSRLSRFTVDLATLVADPGSEQILIDQYDEHLWHQGGALFFHPVDGFLYLTVGDEGDYRCAYENCQRIDRDLFSGVLRIDVDQRGGSVSHPIPRQPESGTTANYFIPNDNPFVGQPGVLEEFYALGLRSPHRMTYDAVDGLGWIGEVGQFQREELDILVRGGNYQWHAREAFLPGPGPTPAAPPGIWTEPVLELQRAEAVAVVGGYVYRGSAFPELRGKYIFADFGRGNIWALTYEHDGDRLRVVDRQLLLQREFRITSFGVDAEGELYFLLYGVQRVQRLEPTAGVSNVPDLLSETQAFDSLKELTPSAALLPYGVQSPLWSDGAQKHRWMLLPSDENVEFSATEPWSFPQGTLFVKHFSVALDERSPADTSPLETRFLVRNGDGGYYGVTYRWNAAGTDAELVRERMVEVLDIVQADGSTRQQRYLFPGPSDCLVCHNAEAGHVLGVRTAQLNGSFAYPSTGRSANQLLTWAKLGIFGASLSPATSRSEVDEYPSLAALGDETRSLEDRVRSYWDANCSMCHGVTQDIRASWDARYSTPLAEQGVLWGEPFSAAGGAEGELIISPGDPLRSVLFLRSATTDPNLRMPPLGRSRVDTSFVEALEAWILSLQ